MKSGGPRFESRFCFKFFSWDLISKISQGKQTMSLVSINNLIWKIPCMSLRMPLTFIAVMDELQYLFDIFIYIKHFLKYHSVKFHLLLWHMNLHIIITCNKITISFYLTLYENIVSDKFIACIKSYINKFQQSKLVELARKSHTYSIRKLYKCLQGPETLE